MGDLDMIFEDRSEVPSQGRPAAVGEEPAGNPDLGVGGQGRRSRWWMWAGAASVVAVVAIGVTFLPAPTGSGKQPEPGTSPGGSPVPPVDVVQVLNQAAAAALKEPEIAPSAGQFVYTKYADGRQVWRSADGSQNGLVENGDGTTTVLPACGDGQPAKPDGTGGVHPCGMSGAAYQPNLPTDPDTLLRLLNDGMPYDPDQPGDVNRVGKGIMELTQDSYLQPRTLAALFEAVARIPGLRVGENATDGMGRKGVAISWSYSGTNELVFDATSHAFLGVTTTADNGAKGVASVVRVAIVDRAGQLPAA